MIQLFVLYISVLSMPSAQAQETIGQWLQGVTAPPKALAVMDAYPGGTLSPAFRQTLSDWTRNHLATAAQKHLDQAIVSCETKAEVSFVEGGTFGTSDAEKKFEEGLFIVESVYCLDGGTAAQTAAFYNSSALRVQVMPLVNAFSLSGNQMCLSTESKAGLLKPTSFCHDVQQMDGPKGWGLAGWLTSNDPAEDIQPLYFRETAIIFVDRPDGGVAGFRGVVTRSRDLGALQRQVLRTIVGAGHSRVESGINAHIADEN